MKKKPRDVIAVRLLMLNAHARTSRELLCRVLLPPLVFSIFSRCLPFASSIHLVPPFTSGQEEHIVLLRRIPLTLLRGTRALLFVDCWRFCWVGTVKGIALCVCGCGCAWVGLDQPQRPPNRLRAWLQAAKAIDAFF